MSFSPAADLPTEEEEAEDTAEELAEGVFLAAAVAGSEETALAEVVMADEGDEVALAFPSVAVAADATAADCKERAEEP